VGMSLAEIESRDAQCAELSKTIRTALDALDKSSRRALELDHIRSQVDEFQTALDAIKIELKSPAISHTERESYRKRHKEYRAILEQLKADIEWKEKDQDREDLMGDRKAPAHDYSTEGGLIAHGDAVLDASGQSLQRAAAGVTQAVEIGKDVTKKLQSQTAQNANQIDSLYQIENMVDRSAMIMRRMARKIASDKYMWVMAFLVFAAIVFIIVWKQVKDGADVEVPDALKKLL